MSDPRSDPKSGPEAGRTERLPLAPAGDTQLAQWARAGDGAAFAHLFDRYFTRLYQFAAWLTGNPDLGAEVTAATFRRVVETRLMYGESSSFAVRLFTIARDQALGRREPAGRADLTQPAGGPAGVPASAQSEHDLVDPIGSALGSLDEPSRSALYLAARENLALADIAEILDVMPDEAAALVGQAQATLAEAGSPADASIDPIERFAEPALIVPPSTLRAGVWQQLQAAWPVLQGTKDIGSALPAPTAAPEDFGRPNASRDASDNPPLDAPRGVPRDTPRIGSAGASEATGGAERSPNAESTIRIALPRDPSPAFLPTVFLPEILPSEDWPPPSPMDAAPAGANWRDDRTGDPPPDRPDTSSSRRKGPGPLWGPLLAGLIFGILATGAGLAVLLANSGFLAGPGGVVPSPTTTALIVALPATETETPTATATATVSPPASATIPPSPTANPVTVAEATDTPAPTVTPTATATASPSPVPSSPTPGASSPTAPPATATNSPIPPTATATAPPPTPTGTSAPAAAELPAATATPRPPTATSVATTAPTASSATASPSRQVSGSVAVRPDRLDFGPTEDMKTIQVSNLGRQPLGWAATTDEPWIDVDPIGGILPVGEGDPLTVSIQRSRLPSGTQRGSILISSDDGELEVPVTVTGR